MPNFHFSNQFTNYQVKTKAAKGEESRKCACFSKASCPMSVSHGWLCSRLPGVKGKRGSIRNQMKAVCEVRPKGLTEPKEQRERDPVLLRKGTSSTVGAISFSVTILSASPPGQPCFLAQGCPLLSCAASGTLNTWVSFKGHLE